MKFVEPVVTEVWGVEKWVREEYGEYVRLDLKAAREVSEDGDEEEERKGLWEVAMGEWDKARWESREGRGIVID